MSKFEALEGVHVWKVASSLNPIPSVDRFITFENQNVNVRDIKEFHIDQHNSRILVNFVISGKNSETKFREGNFYDKKIYEKIVGYINSKTESPLDLDKVLKECEK